MMSMGIDGKGAPRIDLYVQWLTDKLILGLVEIEKGPQGGVVEEFGQRRPEELEVEEEFFFTDERFEHILGLAKI
jgi:hypothetical protein